MLKIRLKRVGRKNDPSYRVVVVPHTTGPKSGKVVEVLGHYDPRKNVKEIKAERVQYWIGEGAKPSDTVHNLLVSEKIIDGKKVNALPRKTPIKKSSEEKVASQPAETNKAQAGTQAKPNEESTDETVAEPEAAPEVSVDEKQTEETPVIEEKIEESSDETKEEKSDNTVEEEPKTE
jgi:small subunit ribosomal protein S16